MVENQGSEMSKNYVIVPLSDFVKMEGNTTMIAKRLSSISGGVVSEKSITPQAIHNRFRRQSKEEEMYVRIDKRTKEPIDVCSGKVLWVFRKKDDKNP